MIDLNHDTNLGEQHEQTSQLLRRYEFIDCPEFAKRMNLPESWVRDAVRHRSGDPLPHARFGKYVRFRWGSPELEEWIERRIIGGSNRKVRRAFVGKETQ